MAPLSNAAIESANVPQTGEVWLMLMRIEHPDFGVIRLVGNTVDIGSNGNTYTAVGIVNLDLPDEEDQVPEVTVTISDTSQELTAALRPIDSRTSGKPLATTAAILASAPDVEMLVFEWEVSEARVGRSGVTLKLNFQNVLNEPFPYMKFVPSLFPSLF